MTSNQMLQRILADHDDHCFLNLFDGNISKISNDLFTHCTIFEELSDTDVDVFLQLIHRHGIHVLAYYVSPHISQRYFGIYFNKSGINSLANFFKKKLKNNSQMNDLINLGYPETNNMLIKLAKKMLLRHELGHYAVDYSLTKCDILQSNKYFEFKRIINAIDNPILESICNANISRQSLKLSNKFESNSSIEYKINLNEFCNQFMDIQPFEYTQYEQFIKNYSESCVNTLHNITGLEFNLTDFKAKIKDKTAKSIPMYMVNQQ
jgi:hypothetical protein